MCARQRWEGLGLNTVQDRQKKNHDHPKKKPISSQDRTLIRALVIVTGNPGVFQLYPYPYPPNPLIDGRDLRGGYEHPREDGTVYLGGVNGGDGLGMFLHFTA